MKIEGTKSDVTFLLLLLAASLSGNVYLGRLLLRPPGAPAPPLAKGAAVPPLPVTSLDGRPQTVSYEGQPTVLYVFSPTCPWCRRNIPNLKQLVQSAGARYRFIGLSLDDKGLAAYVTENQLPMPVYTKISDESRAQYRLGGVPQTIVVSSRGTVLQVWNGAFVGDTQREVEGFFEVALPGLADGPVAHAGNDARSSTMPQPPGKSSPLRGLREQPPA
jgi:hypothetical protein